MIKSIVKPVVNSVVNSVFQESETLLAEYEITLGDVKLATADGEAMAFMPDVVEYQSDFSSDLDGWPLTTAGTPGLVATWTHDTDHGVLAVTSVGDSSVFPAINKDVLTDGETHYFTVDLQYTVNSGTCIVRPRVGGIIQDSVTLTGSGTLTNANVQQSETLTGKDAITYFFDGRNTFNISIHSITVTKHPAKTYLEPYQGNDTDSTPYRLDFTDDAAVESSAYGGSVGGGLAYGAEVATGTLDDGTLYQITATEVDHFGTGLVIDDYFTSDGTETCDVNNTVKPLTDVPATGLHLLSEQDDSTRNMASVGAGFNPKNVEKIEIWKL